MIGSGIALFSSRKVGVVLKVKNLLVPVDYSPRCLVAAECVRVLATRSDVEVTVLHVTDERAQQRADEDVIRAFSDRLTGFDIAFSEMAGNPAQRIIEHARSYGTDLIVMPTRGHGTLRRFLLGSVTDKVLRSVDCPVWTGALTNKPAFGKGLRITTVACGIDLGPRSANVLQWASELADSFDAHLTVIHASAQLVPVTGIVHDLDWRIRVAQVLRAELSELITKVGIKAEIRLAAGEPAEAIAIAAERVGAGVLVIGRSPKGLVGRLRPNAFGIIRQSSCAVVSVDPTTSCREKVVKQAGMRRTLEERLDRDYVPAGAVCDGNRLSRVEERLH